MANLPVMIATWPFGVEACENGWRVLSSGGSALDAIETGANSVEINPGVASVGYGGLPNAEGVVELDAAIMDGRRHTAGCVAGIHTVRKPISLARCVMDRSPHTMIVGAAADAFARDQGFPVEDLSTLESRGQWEEWRQRRSHAHVAHFTDRVARKPAEEDHDTIGLCALDAAGNLAAGCTTSGLAWKQPGRVGDSPLIGCGLYADNQVGAAAGTGHGDEMMKAVLSYRVVNSMERGYSPTEACVEAIKYLQKKIPPEDNGNYGAALIALRKDGAYGAAATASGFEPPDRLWKWAAVSAGQVRLMEGVYVSEDRILTTLSAPPASA